MLNRCFQYMTFKKKKDARRARGRNIRDLIEDKKYYKISTNCLQVMGIRFIYTVLYVSYGTEKSLEVNKWFFFCGVMNEINRKRCEKFLFLVQQFCEFNVWHNVARSEDLDSEFHMTFLIRHWIHPSLKKISLVNKFRLTYC